MPLPRQISRGPVRFLLHYVSRRLGSHSLVMGAVLAAVFCAVGSNYGVKDLVDALGMQGDRAAPWHAVLILLVLVAGDNLLWRLAGWAASHAFVAVGGDMRLDLFEHLAGHGTRYFVDQFPGALAGRVTTATTAAWTIENSLTWTTIPPATAVLSSIAVLGLIEWQLTAVLTVVVTILAVIIGYAAARGLPRHERYASEAASVSGELTDVVANIALVRTFGAARREHERLAQRIGQEMAAQRSSLLSLEGLRLFHAVMVFLVTAGVLVWSVSLWQQGKITTGDVVLTTSLGFTVLHASRDLAMALVDLVQHFAKLGEALRVLGMPHEMPDEPNAAAFIPLGGWISFNEIGFAYPGGERVLDTFSLEIPAGQKVGLVGRSGAGKSTILALLQRHYDPTCGRILIDEQDISGVTQDSLRNSIAVVHQDVALFHRSVLENLRYGRPDASDEDVYEAAASARCTEFIARLPDGFHTIVGERGMKLSGGQRQRLAIARAFLRDAQIILFDEATSSLDSESEQLVQEALMQLIRNRTMIAVAHRLSTLSRFDRIIVLDRGRIVEDGAPQELLGRDSIYRQMVGRQSAVAGH
jgi:ATP-binding cassette subfamily B protein